MKLYCISQPKSDEVKTNISTELLREACRKNGVEFVAVEPHTFDFLNPPLVNTGDAVYRISRGPLAQAIERFLIHKTVATFYSSFERAYQSFDDLLLNRINNLPTPKTIFGVTNNYQLLCKYGEELGFPLILKVLGKSMGNGVIKVDSIGTLSSLVSCFGANTRERIVLKSFIDGKFTIRVIVIGAKAVSAITYTSRRGDFRSNIEKNPLMGPFPLTTAVEHLATRAASTIGLEFGGVDILVDKNEKIYLAEINFPCAFPDVQLTTGVDVADLMVKHLQIKSHNLITQFAQ